MKYEADGDSSQLKAFTSTYIRMAKLQKQNYKCWKRYGETQNLILPYDPATPLLGICTEKLKAGTQITCTTMFMAALFTIAKCGKKQTSTER